MVDRGKSFCTIEAEWLKAHLPNSEVIEGRTTKFQSLSADG